MKNAVVTGAVIRFRGIVQGVGFRPLLFRRAKQYGLKGIIRNTGHGVYVRVDGGRSDIEGFYNDIREHPPAMAEIHDSSLEFIPLEGFEELSISASSSGNQVFTPVSPDIATCPACFGELNDPEDRRYRYPFINCTDCGPRFTIIQGIPYDRARTTMSVFPMCEACAAEYGDITDRRYHAQPNACAVCGPSLRFVELPASAEAQAAEAGRHAREAAPRPESTDLQQAAEAGRHPDETAPRTGETDPLERALEYLRKGLIIAVRGLGGYHLAVSPVRADRVLRLRQRKKRGGKPFALMARDLETARKYCTIGPEEERLLLSPQRPIVLLRRNDGPAGRKLPDEIAPDIDRLGIMLPYTPLHHLLMQGEELLIMTSANLSEEPLAYREREAVARLCGIADGLLTHNREIARPCDDSVVTVVRGRQVMLRRSRGYVPRAVSVEFRNGSVPETQVFAAGAHEKNVFCVYKEGKAFPGHHIGDLGNLISTEAYERGVADFFEMFQVRPEVVACDLHPDYHSTRYAEALSTTLEVPLVRVQHHCAHIAAVLGEAGAPAGEHADNARRSAEKDQGVIGIAFDGTGYGTDGTIWGGEFLVFDGSGFTRAAHYEAVPMPGGEACVSSIDRMAAAYLIHTYGGQVPRLEMIDRIGEDVMSRLRIMIGRGMNTPRTSSCGRLFDAVSALLGLCVRPSYDAQGAILLEQAAGGSELQTGRLTGGLKNPYPFSFGSDGVLSFKPAIRAIVDDMRRGTPVSETAARFHTTVVYSAVEVCRAIAGRTGIRTAALSGGVFQNRIILERLWEALEQEGFTVLFHHQVPPNDGGIAFGQVVCALNGWGINGG